MSGFRLSSRSREKRHPFHGSGMLSFVWLLDPVWDMGYNQHLCGQGCRQNFIPQEGAAVVRLLRTLVLCSTLLGASELSMGALDLSCQAVV